MFCTLFFANENRPRNLFLSELSKFCQTRSDSLWCSNNFSHSHTQFFTLICSEMSHSRNQLSLRRAALLSSSLMWTEHQNTVKKGPDNRGFIFQTEQSITICLDRSNTNPYDRFGTQTLFLFSCYYFTEFLPVVVNNLSIDIFSLQLLSVSGNFSA